ncbi:MAG: cupin domain-containing protein [Burkholderiaceae bacterium]
MPPETRARRERFYQAIAPQHLAPLWEVLRNIVPPTPRPAAVPHQWSYAALRPHMLESGRLLTAEEAERRVLVLENPSYSGQSRTTASLYAGIQMILPGEVAPAHRHTPSALRLLIEGERGFTAVGGERTTMREGDFVITPAWAWHDHGNEGDAPVIWLDGLDIPMLGYFEAVFMEGHDARQQTVQRPEGASRARFGQSLLPIDALAPYGPTSPIFNYPYETTREALVRSAQAVCPDPHFATTLRYANPLDGGWPMPTMATWMTHVAGGRHTARVRSTDSMVMSVVEGEGEITIGDQTFRYAPKDTIAIPGWQWRSLSASADSFLFFLGSGGPRETRVLPRRAGADLIDPVARDLHPFERSPHPPDSSRRAPFPAKPPNQVRSRSRRAGKPAK